MTKSRPIDINSEWANRKLPIVNGIVYSDGSIDLIEISFVGNKRNIQHNGKSSLNNLLSKNELGFSSIMIASKVEDVNKKICVYCGEGSFGGDGFVVVESNIDSCIKWIAFFENANPFEKIEIINDKIFAYNNLGEKWEFDINNPRNISIS
jgi:hypothetical protein